MIGEIIRFSEIPERSISVIKTYFFEDFNMFILSLNERFSRNGIETTPMYIDKAVMRLFLNLFLCQFKAGVLPHPPICSQTLYAKCNKWILDF